MKQNRLSNLTRKIVAKINRLRDVRVIGLYAFVLAALLVSWNGVGVIQSNYKLQKQISELEQQKELQKLENDTLRLKNEYYNTDQYMELVVRKQFGKGAPGEKLLLVPEEIALKYAGDLSKDEVTLQKPKVKKPFYQQNFEAWMEFFFRRNIEK